jgi:hypothetical protein
LPAPRFTLSEIFRNSFETFVAARANIRCMSIANVFDQRAGAELSAIQGQVLRRSERREAAIFIRDNALWVADFVDGRGKLHDAITWIRFNCGAASTLQACRRMALESALPLTPELTARIEALQASREETPTEEP